MRSAQGLGKTKPRGEAGARKPSCHVGKQRRLTAEEMGHAGNVEPEPVIAIRIQGRAVAGGRPAGEGKKRVFILLGRGGGSQKMRANGAGIGETKTGGKTFADASRIDGGEHKSAILVADKGERPVICYGLIRYGRVRHWRAADLRSLPLQPLDREMRQKDGHETTHD